ncbi:MAG: AAA family ATPase [Gammaproteobacteria bacterium]|nr:AAA family ATPase [Gammaproteobacteria bacterium]
MRFERLYLKAYGRFTDCVVDLPRAGDADLQLIYGPNEAGKSTVLSGVTDFLFGFPNRTELDFIHAMKDLRVGAALALGSGEVVYAVRRKGLKRTLFALDPDTGAEDTTAPLDEALLARHLPGMDRARYRGLFGFDLDGLVAGGEELVKGKGEVGQGLFQAAAGLASLKALADELTNEAAELFKPRGSTGALNVALRQYDEQRRALREATVRTSAWQQLESELGRARAHYDSQRHAYAQARAERERLERIRVSLPLLAERRLAMAELDVLEPVPVLPADAAQQRVAAQERLRNARETREAAAAELDRLVGTRASIVVRADVLDQAAAIEQSWREASAREAARKDIERREAQRDSAIAQAQDALAGIAPDTPLDHAATLLPPETLIARIDSLDREAAVLGADLDALDTEREERSALLARLRDSLGALASTHDAAQLDAALAQLESLVAISEQESRLARDAGTLRARVDRAAAALGCADAAKLAATALPMPDTLADYERRFTDLNQEAASVDDREAGILPDLDGLRQKLRTLRATGEVVTRADVVTARAHRDAGWALARRAWERGEEVRAAIEAYAAGASLGDAVEAAIREADRLADLLHADVARTTQVLDAQQRIEAMEGELGKTEARRRQLGDERADLEHRWGELVAPLGRPVLTPAAAREWLQQHARFSAEFERLATLEQDLGAVRVELDRLGKVLDAAFDGCGEPPRAADESLRGAMLRLQRIDQAARRTASDRDRLEARIADAERNLGEIERRRAQAQAKLEHWRQRWSAAVTALHLPAEASAEEVRVRIRQLTDLRKALEALAAAARELARMRAGVSAFDEQLRATAVAVGEPVDGRPPAQTVESLHTALAHARAAAQKLREVDEAVRSERARGERAELAQRQADEALRELVAAAGCGSVAELPLAEERAQRKCALRERVRQIEETLVAQNACAVTAVAAQADGFEPDGVRAGIDALDAQAERLDAGVQAANAALVETEQRFKAVDGSARAADIQQALAELQATIAERARACARARLAGAMLVRVVQRYREQHQGPVLAGAGRLFAAITAGSFRTLMTDYDDDRQVILGVRPDDTRVPITGMSQGTRDQLFLALRLATIEQHVAGHGAFPLIFDDLLVQFDDERAVAALRVLKELATRTQVLFFTHHRHLIDLARASGVAPPAAVHVL